MALLILSLWPATALAEEAAVPQAAELHERGILLFQQGSYQDAIQAFEQAEQIAHSRTNIMNLARCHQELGEHEQALRYLDRYLQEPNLPQDARARAEQMRQQLQQSGGGGGNLAGPWALLGSGLGLLVIGGVLDIVAYVRSDPETYDQLESVSEYDDWHDSTTSLAIAGDVLVGVGAAVAVGGLIWLLVARSRRSSERASVPSLAVVVGRDGLALHTQLRF
jgi:tetratricopeptide (TPR) repeat protein